MTPAEQQAHHHRTVLLPIMLCCLGYACFNLGDAGVKLLASKFHFSQFFLLMNLVGVTFLALYGWKTEGKKAFTTKKPKLMFLRACISPCISFCNILALPHIHLTTFYTIVFTSPFLVALISSFTLGDKLGWRRMSVIVFGFVVVLFIFRPGSEGFNIWAGLALIGVILYSLQMVLVRYIGTGESRPFLIMAGGVMNILISLPFLPTHFIMPNLYEWSLFIMMGLTGSIGFLCISYAYQHAPSAAVVAPYHYTQIIWGAILGYFIFHEVPSIQTMIGAVLIIGAGLYLIHHETRQRVIVDADSGVVN